MDNVEVQENIHSSVSCSRKRKQDNDTGQPVATPPKYPLLESVANRFEQNRQEQQERANVFKTRRETERFHSRYIQEGIGYTLDLLKAKSAAAYWAKKNGVKDNTLSSKQRGYPSPDTSARGRSAASSSPSNHSARSSERQSRTRNQPVVPSASLSAARSHLASARSPTITHQSKSAPVHSKNAGVQSASTSTSSLNTSSQSSNTSAVSSQSPVMVNQSRTSRISADGSPSRVAMSASTDSVSNTGDTVAGNESENIIDLDQTSDDSLILVTEHSPSVDRSNNANTRQQSENRCKVLSCEAKFSSAGALGQHMNLFKHCPCNPCLKATDCKLSPDPLCFLCPYCDREFQTSEECSDHMKVEKHLPFYPPLSVAGYMCAQCLYVFESFGTCWQHIEQSSHRDICYPFADDLTSHTSGVGPVPVIRELVDDLVKKCDNVSFKIQCLECSMEIGDPGAMRQHMLETNNLHVLSALCDSNLVDVFAGYLAGYSCDKCKRLFNGDLKNGAKHDCAKGLIGTIMENDIRSFFDFVKCCALTLIKSVDSKGCSRQTQPRPGPSQRGRGRASEDVASGPAGNLRSSGNTQEQVELLSSDEDIDFEDDTEDDEDEEDDDTDDDDDCVIVGVEKGKAPRPSSAAKPGASKQTSPSRARRKKKRRKNRWKKRAQAAKKGTRTVPSTASERAKQGQEEANITLIPGLSNSGTVQTNVGNQTTTQTTAGSQNVTQPNMFAPVHLPPPPLAPAITAGLLPLPPFPPLLPLPNVCLPPPPVNPPVNLQAIPQYGTRVPFYPPNAVNTRAPVASSNMAEHRLQVPRPAPSEKSQRSKSPVNAQMTSKSSSGKQLQVPKPGNSRDRSRSRSPINGQGSDASSARERSRSPMESDLISTTNLSKMKNIIFLDLDNWCSFFNKLPRVLPDLTFVWGFFGGKKDWYEPNRCYVFKKMKENGQFYLNERCGFTKDAADFAIVLTVGKMDERLPNDVAFTILSGDTGFMEVERQMRDSPRKAVVINPHNAEKFSNEMIYTMVTSVTDT